MPRGDDQEKEVANPAEIGACFSCKREVSSLPETGRAGRARGMQGDRNKGTWEIQLCISAWKRPGGRWNEEMIHMAVPWHSWVPDCLSLKDFFPPLVSLRSCMKKPPRR